MSLTKNEYGSSVHFLKILIKSLKSMSDQWPIAICWSSLLLGIKKKKKWVVLNLTSFGPLKKDCVIKARALFNFLPLMNN